MTARTSNPIPQDEVSFEVSSQWLFEDDCLAVLAMLTVAHESGSQRLLETVAPIAREHEQQCGRCYASVRRTSATARDPLQRLAYDMIHQRFSRAFIMHGGDYRIRHAPEGTYYYAAFAPDLPVPYSSAEVFQPRKKGTKGKVFLDVRSEQDFKNPRPLLQHLDEVTTNDVKTFDAETGRLHWRSLLADEDWVVYVRWRGMVKEIAPGYTLHARYEKLIQRQMDDRTCELETHCKPEDMPALSYAALLLRDLVLRYDESSWFAGYLRKALWQRGIDRYREREREPVEVGEGLDTTKSGDAEAEPEQRVQRAPQEAWAADQDRATLLERLLPLLDGTDLRILALKAEGWTDAAIGAELGLVRGTVTRKRLFIIELADSLRN